MNNYDLIYVMISDEPMNLLGLDFNNDVCFSFFHKLETSQVHAYEDVKRNINDFNNELHILRLR